MNPVIEALGNMRFAKMFGPYIDVCYTDTEKEITLENIQNGFRKFPICFTSIVDSLILEVKATLEAAEAVKEVCE
jgi:hypothetical protein